MALSLLFIVYCFEAGLFFIIAPWTRFWSVNPLLHASAGVGSLVDNFYFRGLVSGFGVVHLILGVVEIISLVRASQQAARTR
ncbi:MAG TPA: hypothetical protein VM534_00715 [Thermoanaerobaculia bacterium]|nr:hypothetical protein [Thermoanaerobaculia bacterium]